MPDTLTRPLSDPAPGARTGAEALEKAVPAGCASGADSEAARGRHEQTKKPVSQAAATKMENERWIAATLLLEGMEAHHRSILGGSKPCRKN